MAVPVKDGDKFDFGEPTVLFQTPLTIHSPPPAYQYDASPDGGDSPPGTNDSSTIAVIVNWTAVLRK